MRALAGYGLAGAGLVAVVGAVVVWILGGAAVAAVWWAAGVAYAVQLVAFAALVAVRDRGSAFFAAWGAGMLVRFGLVLGAAVWLARSEAHPPAAALLSLVGFLFLLLLLEPVFFRLGTQRR